MGAEGVVGLMARPVITADVTVRLADGEVIPFNAAVTVVEPAKFPVAMPVVLAIVAIEVLPDDHVTWLVMSAVDASVYVPVAMKLVVSPFATEAVDGVTAMLVNVLAVTVKAALLEVMPLA